MYIYIYICIYICIYTVYIIIYIYIYIYINIYLSMIYLLHSSSWELWPSCQFQMMCIYIYIYIQPLRLGLVTFCVLKYVLWFPSSMGVCSTQEVGSKPEFPSICPWYLLRSPVHSFGSKMLPHKQAAWHLHIWRIQNPRVFHKVSIFGYLKSTPMTLNDG